MVGVPGRSKACHTCRSRKKGCGRQLPSCIQCVQSGLVCGGYARERIWVNDTASKSWKGPSTYEAKRQQQQQQQQGNPPTVVALHQGLCQTARQELYLGHYWDTYRPNCPGFTPDADFATIGWVGVPPGLSDHEPALKYALAALGASTVAIHGNDPGLKVKGLQAYTTAVKELSAAVKEPQRLRGDGLLGAIRLMGFFEVVFGAVPDTPEMPGRSSQIDGWQGHISGETTILCIRGPESFASGPAHQLFSDARLQILSLAISTRRRSVLGQAAWKSVPWRQSQKTAKDLALDILADVPGLMEDLDRLRSCRDEEMARDMYNSLQRDVDRARADLELWKTAYGGDIAKFDHGAGGSLPAPTTAEDLRLLRLAHIHWMTCGFVFSTGHFAYEAAKGHPQYDREASEADLRDTKAYVSKIAHAVHLFTQPERRLASFHAAVIPIGAALRLLNLVVPWGEPSEERTMLLDYLQQPFMGSYAGKFMHNMQRFLAQKDVSGMPLK